MSTNSESQCYFVQLQIDIFLDGDLSAARQDVFMSHVHQCAGCAAELRYAQTIQDSLLDLPQLDCNEQVLAPVHRLAGEQGRSRLRLPAGLQQWLGSLTPAWRYAMPAVLVAAVILALVPMLSGPGQNDAVIATQDTANPQNYSPEEVAAALQELNLAIDYLNEVSQRTEVMIGERFLVTPLRESLNASFEQVFDDEEETLNDGPI